VPTKRAKKKHLTERWLMMLLLVLTANGRMQNIHRSRSTLPAAAAQNHS